MQQFRNRNITCLLKGLVDLALRFARPVAARPGSSYFRAGVHRIGLAGVDSSPYVVPHALDDRLPGRISRAFVSPCRAAHGHGDSEADEQCPTKTKRVSHPK